MYAKLKLIVLISLIFSLWGKAGEYSTRFYTSADGLSGNEVRDIFQDSNGFLWFATGNGLSRFDGQQFINFQKSRGIDKPLLSTIKEDRNGTIWVSGRDGVYYLPKDSLHFKPLKGLGSDIVTGMGVIRNKRIIISIRGKGFFEAVKDSIIIFREFSRGGREGNQYYVYTQSNGVTFFCENDKIFEYRDSTHIDFVGTIPIGSPNMIYRTGKNLYIATTLGAFSLNLENRQLHSLMSSTNSYNCLDILEDSFGYLWLATNRGLLYREPGKKDFTVLKSNTVPFIATTWYWRVFEDKVNNLWFSPAGFGIGKLNYRFFVNYTIFSGMPSAVHWLIKADKWGGFWLAGPSGLDYYRDKSTFPENGEKYLSGFDIRSLAIINSHQIYLSASNQGVFYFDLDYGNLKRILFDPEKPGLTANGLIFLDSKRLLIGTDNGLYLQKKNGFKRLEIDGEHSNLTVWTMKQAKGGIIWVGTDNGLYASKDPESGKWKHWGIEEELSYRNVKSLEPVSEKSVWIAYFEAGGASKINFDEEKVIRQLNIKKGLPSDKVFTIVHDYRDNTWFGTGNGLCRVHNLKIDIFDINWGLLWIDFWRNAVYADRDSSIWFATSLGLSRYIPKYEVYPGEPLKIKIMGAWYNEDTGKEITENKEIPYEENYIRIRYAALNFKSEKEIEFFYRLEPVSPQWKPAPAGIIEFRSLAPGTYRFEVSSIESNRRSSENSAVLIFTVAPPFYLRAEFVLITVLLILLAFWWLISLKTKKMRERNILLNTEVKKRTKDLEGKNIQLQEVVSKLQRTQAQLVHSEKMASLGLLSAGLAHEVRNPVSFTVTNALYLKGELQDLLREKEVDKEDALRIKEMLSSLDAICEGSKRVEQVVNNLQSFASPQEAEYKRVNLNQNLESTLKLIKARYAKRIDFELRFAPDLPSIYCYPSLLNQVFLNLLINAIHAIPETGKITIATSVKKNDFIEISVADTGEGIPEEVRERIFDPFFTTKPVGTGTGLGLAISHSIITGKHKGKILFESEVGKGTVFRVLIPSNLPAKPDQDER